MRAASRFPLRAATCLRLVTARCQASTLERGIATVTPKNKPFFSEYPFQRQEKDVTDAHYNELLNNPSSWLVPMCDSKALIRCKQGGAAGEEGAPVCELVRLQPLSNYLGKLNPGFPPVLLGLDGAGEAVFTAEVASTAAEQVAGETEAAWQPVRSKGYLLGPEDAAVAATSGGILAWHKNNRFCGLSGVEMVPQEAGWARRSPSTGRSIYPRIDPAIITLVTCGDYALLGRNVKWTERRYSLLSGFVEIGETLEGAVCREVFEESGVQVDPQSISYVESQPWPFPQSLMLGFRGTCEIQEPADGHRTDLLSSQDARRAAIDSKVTDAELLRYLTRQLPSTRPQAGELLDVRWFHRDCLREAWRQQETFGSPQGASFKMPGSHSLAGRMISSWAHDTPPSPLDEVSNCIISDGRAKYVLLRVSDQDGRSKLVVRSDTHANYHMDVFHKLKSQCLQMGLHVEPAGGGRLLHEPDRQAVSIFGYSVAFGPAVHEIAAAIVQTSFPFYDEITVSYEGY